MEYEVEQKHLSCLGGFAEGVDHTNPQTNVESTVQERCTMPQMSIPGRMTWSERSKTSPQRGWCTLAMAAMRNVGRDAEHAGRVVVKSFQLHTQMVWITSS